MQRGARDKGSTKHAKRCGPALLGQVIELKGLLLSMTIYGILPW
jgi:hypothetical protein